MAPKPADPTTDAEPGSVWAVGPQVTTPAIAKLAGRALAYLDAGFPVHFRGPAGSGKTRLALDVAERLGRPVLLLVGDASFDTAALVGSEAGSRTRRVVDRYVTSVMKVETETAPIWLDRALTIACSEGCTLVYDEFNRAPASANNVLLPILEERLLVLPKSPRGDGAMRVHPQFRAIFTSNPEDHAGTERTQDALLDRLMTLDLDGFDRETEIAIAAARSGLGPQDAARIVDLVRDFRRSKEWSRRPTLRASLMIARLSTVQGLPVSAEHEGFVELCVDVLGSRLRRGADGEADARARQMLVRLIEHYCGPAQATPATPRVERAA